MENTIIVEKVFQIIRQDVSKQNQIPLDVNTNLRDIQINSLNFLKIIVEIEEAFDIEFDEREIGFEFIGDIASIVDLINQKIESTN